MKINQKHWPKNVWIEKNFYNLYWCIIDGKTVTGYDDIRFCIKYINDYLTKK